MKILITSGGTKVPIDAVRFITNMSKGTFGSRIALELLKLGHDVIFFKAGGSKSPFSLTVDYYEENRSTDSVCQELDNNNHRLDYNEKLEDLYKLFIKYQNHYVERVYTTFLGYESSLNLSIKYEHPDVVVLAAAVSDYGIENYVDGKIHSKDDLVLKLRPLPKVISKVKEWAPKVKLVGFKLLVDSTINELLEAAKKSIKENKCDMVVANDLRDIKNDAHRVWIVKPKGAHFSYQTDPHYPNFLAAMVAHHITEL